MTELKGGLKELVMT